MNHKVHLFILLALTSPPLAMPTFANEMPHGEDFSTNVLFGLLELPFLFGAVFFAFLTARALKGGAFGKGMTLMAWGFLVMGIGHLHMQIEHFTQFNLFSTLFGTLGGKIAWFVALVITWSLSGLGFYNIYKASRGG